MSTEANAFLKALSRLPSNSFNDQMRDGVSDLIRDYALEFVKQEYGFELKACGEKQARRFLDSLRLSTTTSTAPITASTPVTQSTTEVTAADTSSDEDREEAMFRKLEEQREEEMRHSDRGAYGDLKTSRVIPEDSSSDSDDSEDDPTPRKPAKKVNPDDYKGTLSPALLKLMGTPIDQYNKETLGWDNFEDKVANFNNRRSHRVGRHENVDDDGNTRLDDGLVRQSGNLRSLNDEDNLAHEDKFAGVTRGGFGEDNYFN